MLMKGIQDENRKAFELLNEELVKAIMSDPQTAKVKAFGKFESFIKSDKSIEVTDTAFKKFTVGYTPFIDSGSRPKEAKPSLKDLIEWVGLKKYGINFQTKQQQIGIASAIKRNQEKKGSFKFRNPSERTEIVDKAIEKAYPIFERRLGLVQTRWFESEVQRIIQEINNA